MKIRSILVASLLVVALVSVASAELLVTANPIGQGKWAVLGMGMMDSNVNNQSTWALDTVGGYVGYGAMDKLDVYVNVGQANLANATLLGGTLIQTVNTIGLSGKYQVMDEASAPCSVAIGLGYRSMNTVQGSVNGNQVLLGVGVSKIMAPYVPYAGLTYRSNTQSGNALSTQIDLTVGSAIAWSAQGAVFVEDSLQSITPNGGTSYTSNQVALGVGYKI